MDKSEATTIMKELAAAADAVFAAHGLVRKTHRASFDEGEFSMRLVATATDPAHDPKVRDWKRYAPAYGLDVDLLGKTIRTARASYRITGFEASRRKFPVAVVDVATGKPMLLTVEGVQRVAATAR